MRFILAAIVIFTLFAGCKNDLKLNAPYKEMPIVYAILNPQDTLQTIRINKVFLGQGDANAMAQISDSVNYAPDEITVTLTHTLGTITFSESVIKTAAGVFTSEQRVYTTRERIRTSGLYTLTITNNHTGNVFKAMAWALDTLKLTGFNPFTPPAYPVDKKEYDPYNNNVNVYMDYSSLSQNYTIRYSTQPASAIYNLTMRFHFEDSIVGDPVKRQHYVDYNFLNQYLKDAPKPPSPYAGLLGATFTGSELISGLGYSLSKMNLDNSVYGRRFTHIQYFVYASTQDYMDFMEYAKPSLSINTQKPLYSNFVDKAALGIFTFRTRLSYQKEISYPYINTIAANPSTCMYKFMRADLTVPGCR